MRAMAPRVLAASLVLGLAGHAGAGPGKTSKVTIETDPPGAKVYFNLKEDGEVCTTPCTVDAPIGETPIIVEAENRRSIIENLVVPRKTARPLRVSYKLKPALGSLIVDGGDGAAILIDEQNQGFAPKRFDDIIAGAHHVVLERNGKKLYDGFIEVEIDGEATVTPTRVAAAAPAGEPEPPAVAATREPAEPPRRTPAFAISAASDIGFRQFSFNYRNPTDRAAEHNDREAAEVLTGGVIELWPATLLHLGMLPGLSLYGRFQIGVNPQRVTMQSRTGPPVATSLSTAWRSLEISLRQRWTIANTGTFEVGVGYVDDRYQFDTDNPFDGPAEQKTVPDVAYQAVRIGGRGSLLIGPLEPYVAAENRLVLAGGALANRYTLGTSVNGVRGALGAALHFGHFDIRAEGSVSLYSWTFRHDVADPDYAESGSDAIEQIGLSIGYVY
jgi:PEGA domain